MSEIDKFFDEFDKCVQMVDILFSEANKLLVSGISKERELEIIDQMLQINDLCNMLLDFFGDYYDIEKRG